MTGSFDERNAEKSRRACADMEKAASTGKRVLTERERAILDMWPKFEDGEYVWFEEEVKADPIFGGGTGVAHAIEFMSFTYILKNVDNEPIAQDRFETRVKRPAQSVLDADGVEIKVGDTVYSPLTYGDTSFTVSRFAKNCDGDTIVMFEEMGSGLFSPGLTHVRPDSWERLEEDAEKLACAYYGRSQCACFGCPMEDCIDFYACSREQAKDIVRRAKALAGVEAD